MPEVWTECIMDIVKTIPILFVVYLVISWMENHMDAVTRVVTSTEPAGPGHRRIDWRDSAVRLFNGLLGAVLPRISGACHADCRVFVHIR